MITDNFDNLILSDPTYCTYCWQSYYFGGKICGPDDWRYLDSKADYLAYVRQYLANGCQHAPLGGDVQLRMEI